MFVNCQCQKASGPFSGMELALAFRSHGTNLGDQTVLLYAAHGGNGGSEHRRGYRRARQGCSDAWWQTKKPRRRSRTSRILRISGAGAADPYESRRPRFAVRDAMSNPSGRSPRAEEWLPMRVGVRSSLFNMMGQSSAERDVSRGSLERSVCSECVN